ncbi:MAG: UDP-3-O-acylglucosamine N-acyltransferase [Steroidobacteraceae bacterium]|nr:UDP-3-O-acylglucosamine N-acyltransferase [Steroidobacteraceae bacterium]
MPVSLGELAVRFGCELRGDPDLAVERVATLATAGPDAVAFVANPKYRAQLATTRAAAVIVDAATAQATGRPVLIAANPYATYARIAAVLHPAPRFAPGAHPTAWIAPLAQVDGSAHIGAHVSIGEGVQVGPRVVIGPGCVIEDGCELAADVRLVARVTVCRGTRIGARTLVQPGAVLGADGFGFAPERGTWVKVPQLGRTLIGEDVEIGANTTIDRGAIGDTVIEDGVKLDNQIQIGHNVRIGAHSALAGCVGVSGSVTIGKRCQLGGAVGVAGHLTICDDVAVTGYSLVSHSITEPGVYSSGMPVIAAQDWRRAVARLHRLDRLAGRVRTIEQQLGKEQDD